MNILMTVPKEDARGGVAHFANALIKGAETSQTKYVRLMRGRSNQANKLSWLTSMLTSYLQFFRILLFGNVQIVHINNSLKKIGVLRDYPYIVLSRVLGKPFVVFFHGWDSNYLKNMTGFERFLFKHTFNRTEMGFVLSDTFKSDLLEAGFNLPVTVTTTMLNEDVVSTERVRKDGRLEILYLSRIVKEKGIDIVLDAFNILLKEGLDVKLHIAGTGDYVDEMQMKIREMDHSRITYHGHVEGSLKIQLLNSCHILFFPTYYDEGLPISVLESIACGMVVVTRNVAGLNQLKLDEIGIVTSSLDSTFFANQIKALYTDRDRLKRISEHNYEYGRQFYSKSFFQKINTAYIAIVERNNST